ncbi:MAG: hypothetical protein IT318_24270 [Anaerolineales bacterium]|nr:hypothetical protein [Anaerolineales bacterium]
MTPRAARGRFNDAAGRLLLTSLVVVIVLSLWLRGHQRTVGGPYGQTVADTTLGELLPGRCLGQTFVANAPGLHRVDVFLAIYQRVNHGPLRLHIKASPYVTADLATLTVDMAGVRDNAYQTFKFAPLPLPAGVPAFFCLEAPAARPGNAITVGARQADAYAGGRAQFLDGHVPLGAQDLSFLLFYQPAPSWAVAAGLQRLAANKPGWLGEPLFYAAVFAAYLAVLAALAWGLGGRLIRPVAITSVESAVEPATSDR